MQLLDVNINKAGYDAQDLIISDIRFSLQKGELVGLIGPNGAGKSTTIKAILGVLNYLEGDINFSNETTYAYIPEQPIFYDELTLWEHLDLAASTMNIDDQTFKNRADHLLEVFKLNHVIHQLPSTFSKGMQQKVMIIIAFLIKPSIFIIDEPFIGLDPRAVKDLLFLLDKEREQGASILMSTHVLDTAEKICERFLLVSNGELLANGTMQDIRNKSGLIDGSLFDCFYHLTEVDDNDRK
ncbi:ABC transporter ATP-binding protein [Cytobacillus sp. IB215665]|uniref:ABC transporter ATP-binding protein n=1 Tax=Cytobacillus sp. IB215665 TaxID=3097357 RepID=UPI002A167435|nr:ABC transporter ATP-binding protein [Cytobacillus sp. IB215665]MDX8367468.1 ABC transporter ATP-binding protein [Cytobacillus sp. IB215665]